MCGPSSRRVWARLISPWFRQYIHLGSDGLGPYGDTICTVPSGLACADRIMDVTAQLFVSATIVIEAPAVAVTNSQSIYAYMIRDHSIIVRINGSCWASRRLYEEWSTSFFLSHTRKSTTQFMQLLHELQPICFWPCQQPLVRNSVDSFFFS